MWGKMSDFVFKEASIKTDMQFPTPLAKIKTSVGIEC